MPTGVCDACDCGTIRRRLMRVGAHRRVIKTNYLRLTVCDRVVWSQQQSERSSIGCSGGAQTGGNRQVTAGDARATGSDQFVRGSLCASSRPNGQESARRMLAVVWSR